jgi:hypothetical protein
VKRLLVIASVTTLAVAVTTIGYAASFSLTTVHLGASAVTTPIMFPTTVTITNKGGGTLHKPENGDIITLVYSRLIQASTICSGWTNAGPNGQAKLQWTIVAGAAGADDTLIADGAAAPCNTGFFIGTIDLGAAGYDNSATNINYPTTTATIAFGTSTTTITATLNGQKNGTPAVVSTGNQATWDPDNAVTDRSGNNCGANIAKSASTLQF